MRKKLQSIQNMRSMIMEQTLRKQNIDKKNIEVITINEFRQKLEKLLEKLTIQTKYTNRVSQCHLKNLQELDTVKEELNYLLELRKMEETNQIMLKNLSNQLAQTLNDTQEKLLLVTNEFFALKKQHKQTKAQLSELKKAKSKVDAELRRAEREKYHSLIELHDRTEQKPLEHLIESYLKEVKFPSCQILYKHCVQTLRTKNFDKFLVGLEEKISSDMKSKTIEIERRDSLKEKEKLKNLIIRRKVSNREFQSSGYTSHQRTNAGLNEGSRLHSFRTKTEGSGSVQKYFLG